MLATGAAPAIPWLRLIVALAICLALAGVTVAVLRHYRGRLQMKSLGKLLFPSQAAPSGRIHILETRRASQHGDLCLVEIDRQRYFLALTPAGAVLLDRPEPSQSCAMEPPA